MKILLNCLFALSFLSSCSSFMIGIDRSGINDLAVSILKNYKTLPVRELDDYLTNFDVLSVTDTYDQLSVKKERLNKWRLNTGGIEQERIEFPSCLVREDGSNDTAIFYLYRKGGLKNGKAVLWIPGFGVSDFAFRFIKKFFYEEINAGYAVFFYNIPYHLERVEKGKKPGEGFFTADTEKNLNLIKISLCEIRTGIEYLNSEGISGLSGWGGSVGAALLWLTSASVKFDHLELMIPVVDWNTIVFNPGMKPVIERNEKDGFSEEMIRNAYNRISPVWFRSLTPAGRIQILYARFDQLTPRGTIIDFAEKYGIKNVKGYDESHSSILIEDRMYRDYSDFLKLMIKEAD